MTAHRRRPYLVPVCCVVDIPATFINQFLETTYHDYITSVGEKNSDSDNALKSLAVIERPEGGPIEGPSIPPLADFSAPFKGKNPEEVAQLLLDEAEVPNTLIDPALFIILDERTLRDSSILICGTFGDEEMQIFRSIYKTAQSTVSLISIAHPGINEFVEMAAEEEDGVFKL